MLNLCAPALIYIAFSLTQIIIDTFKGLYNTAFFKAIVMIVITILLNALCQSGMGIISWIIVFVPFIFMSVIVAILLYVFGFDPATGKLNIECTNCSSDANGKTGNLIYSSSSNVNRPNNYIDVSYSETSSDVENNVENNVEVYHVPNSSSDPQYA